MAVVKIGTTRKDQPHAAGHRCVVAELHIYLLRPIGYKPQFGARRIMEFRWDYPDDHSQPRFFETHLPSDFGWQ